MGLYVPLIGRSPADLTGPPGGAVWAFRQKPRNRQGPRGSGRNREAMTLRQRLSHAIDLVAVTHRELSDEQRRFLREWERERVQMMMRALAPALLAVFTIASLASLLLTSEATRVPLTVTHAVAGGMMALYRFVLLPRGIQSRPLVAATAFFVVTGYGVVMWAAFRGAPSPLAGPFTAIMFLGAALLAAILNPLSNAALLLAPLFHYAVGLAAWYGQPYFAQWSVLSALFIALAAVLQYTRYYGIKREALQELAARQLVSQNERLRVEAMEKELAVAREIQDSFAPPPSLVHTDRLTASFYQLKHATLGGDWMAVRKLPGGELAIVVADATGKGVQAALVIHAVQSLWAYALDEEAFDPEAWIQAVNRALRRLGRKKAHSMSLGLALVGPDTLRYYSAGHVPLFILAGDGDDEKILPVVARGNLLGLTDELTLTPTELRLDQIHVRSILIGTDGAFDKGVRVRKSNVVQLLDGLARNGAGALASCPAEDDKLLVWVKRAS